MRSWYENRHAEGGSGTSDTRGLGFDRGLGRAARERIGVRRSAGFGLGRATEEKEEEGREARRLRADGVSVRRPCTGRALRRAHAVSE